MPHVFIILVAIMLLVTLLSFIVPSGEFERTELGTVNPDNFQFVDQADPISFQDFWSAIHVGFVNAGTIMGSLILCSGALGILNYTRALEAGVNKLNKATKGKSMITLVIFYIYFAAMNIMGIGEGAYPFFPIVTALVVSMGYDRLTAAGVIMFAATGGFACGMLNMFTTGISQQIVGLPMFSGMGFRFIVFIVLFTIGLVSIIRYASKIKKDPNKSYISEEYKTDLAALDSKKSETESSSLEFTWRESVTLILFLVLIVWTAYGCLKLGFGLGQFAAYYIFYSVVIAAIYKINPNKYCQLFGQGAGQVLVAALAIGLAQSVMALLKQAQIMDTLVYYMGNALEGKSALITLLLIYLFVTAFNFLVVSGSGKAVMMMPIMSPLGKMLGINQQVMVLTYQLGDGLTNMLWPGGALVCCSLIGINYGDWLKMAWKTFALMIGSGYILVCIANAIGYGPF